MQHSKGENSEENDVLVNEPDVENDENDVDVPNLFENLFDYFFFHIAFQNYFFSFCSCS